MLGDVAQPESIQHPLDGLLAIRVIGKEIVIPFSCNRPKARGEKTPSNPPARKDRQLPRKGHDEDDPEKITPPDLGKRKEAGRNEQNKDGRISPFPEGSDHEQDGGSNQAETDPAVKQRIERGGRG